MFQRIWENYDYAHVILVWYEHYVVEQNRMIKGTWGKVLPYKRYGYKGWMWQSYVPQNTNASKNLL